MKTNKTLSLSSSRPVLSLSNGMRGSISIIRKIIMGLFAFSFFVQLSGSLILATLPNTADAADPIKLQMQVPIPGVGNNGVIDFSTDKSTKPLAVYIRSIYKYAIAVVGILATITMMIGGVMWILSAGDASLASEAKAWITSSLTGLALTLTSYMILTTINPNLTDLKIRQVETVGGLNCCYDSYSLVDSRVMFGKCYDVATKADCKSSFYNKSCNQVQECEIAAKTNYCASVGGICQNSPNGTTFSCSEGKKRDQSLDQYCASDNNAVVGSIPYCCAPYTTSGCKPKGSDCTFNSTCCSWHCTIPPGNYIRGTCD